MSWLSVTLEADCAHAEGLADALMEAGALSATIEDAAAGTAEEKPQFGEPGPSRHRDGIVRESSPCSNRMRILPMPSQSLRPPGTRRSEVPPFPRRKLSGAELGATDAIAVRSDPRIGACGSCRPGTMRPIRQRSTSFSIREWPSEQARIRPPGCAWVAGALRPAGENLLDYGCGSGILAIAGARLRLPVDGVDIDPQAVSGGGSQCTAQQ